MLVGIEEGEIPGISAGVRFTARPAEQEPWKMISVQSMGWIFITSLEESHRKHKKHKFKLILEISRTA